MKTLIITEFRRSLKSLALWTGIAGGLAALMLFLFPMFRDSFSDIIPMLDAYPPEFLEAVGIGEGGLDFTTLYGWYGIQGYLYVCLIGGSFAAILGGSILSKEEDDKTIEFLLSKSIHRSQVLFGKLLVVLVDLFLMNLAISIILLLSFLLFAEFDFVIWILFAFALLLLQIVFATISLLFSIFITKSRQVISVSLGLVLGMYFLKLISTLVAEVSFVKYFTPFAYFDAKNIVIDKLIAPEYILISLLVIIISVLITWRLYLKKDIVT